MRLWLSPSERAASTNSSLATPWTWARTIREIVSHDSAPIAMNSGMSVVKGSTAVRTSLISAVPVRPAAKSSTVNSVSTSVFGCSTAPRRITMTRKGRA